MHNSIILGIVTVLCLSAKAAEEKAWQPLAPMLGERFEHGCALVGDTFYVFGGYGKGVKSSNHVQAFDLAKNKWRRLKDMPSAVTHINPVVDGRSAWIAGGPESARGVDSPWWDAVSTTSAGS